MKKRIRLTESRFKRLVNETARKMINELDYKTYMSAAKKRAEQGNFYKSNNLKLYAQDVADRDYGYNDYDESSFDVENPYVRYMPDLDYDGNKGRAYTSAEVKRMNYNGGYDNDSLNDTEQFHKTQLSLRNYNTRNGKQSNSMFDIDHIKDEYGQPTNKANFDDMEDYFFDKYSHRPYSKDFRLAYNRARDEGRHFSNGDYEYRDGEGWKLKNESRRRGRRRFK